MDHIYDASKLKHEKMQDLFMEMADGLVLLDDLLTESGKLHLLSAKHGLRDASPTESITDTIVRHFERIYQENEALKAQLQEMES